MIAVGTANGAACDSSTKLARKDGPSRGEQGQLPREVTAARAGGGSEFAGIGYDRFLEKPRM